MNPEQQRIAIAEACGWKPDKRGIGWLSPHGYYTSEPDYLNDLNAMHEAEKVLKGGMRSTYDAELTLICSRDYNFIWESTASQRAEAFLRTIGKMGGIEMNDTPRTDEQINGKPCSRFGILAGDSLRNAAVPSEFARELERELNAANAEIEEKRKDVVWLATEKAKLEERIKRLEDSYAAKDAQLSNLLHICRDNDIEVSSYDLIHGKEAKL